jgi:hypothetical protein
MDDITLNIAGSMVGFTGTTKAGADWLQHEVQHEGWQWLGHTLYVAHNYAPELAGHAENAGLTVSV